MNFRDIPPFNTQEFKTQLLAEQIYDLEVTFGLTRKDGKLVKAPPFEEYLERARAIVCKNIVAAGG